MSFEKVVITGAGLITPLGLTRQQTFSAVLEGRCGIGRLSAIECALPEGRDGGEAPALPEDWRPGQPREVRYLSRAISDALADAGLAGSKRYLPERCAIMVGTTLHGIRAAGKFLRSGNYGELSEFLAAQVTEAAAEGLKATGLSATTCSACSSSLGSVALGVTLLASGEFDMIIAGGYDPVSEYAYGGFNSLRLVAEGPLRPFTRGRLGMKLSEGYGIVILERAGDAAARGARPIAVIAGFGESADAHHLTQPHPQGEGAARAMRQALESAGMKPADVGLLVAHATGTPDNDASEFAAMSQVFGEELPKIPCVAFKSHLGHTLGGAGAVELVLAAMAMEKQVAPPCANVRPDEIEYAGLNVGAGAARQATIKATLSTSLGFGGANTCVVLTPAAGIKAKCGTNGWRHERDRDVLVTGVGVVAPGAIGNGQLLELLARERPGLEQQWPLGEEQIAHLVNARRARRLSEYVKLMLAATSVALEDAKVGDVAAFAAECSAILGTMHGSSTYSETYYRQIVEEGVLAANPMLFAEGVPNAGSAHVSLMLGVKGACQTIIGSRTAGLDALGLAARRIWTGQWDRAIVGAAEEHSPLTQASYKHHGLGRDSLGGMPFECGGGFVSASGSVVLVLESRAAAEKRGVTGRGVVRQVASRRGTDHGGVRGLEEVIKAIGSPRALMTSANATWIDRLERAAIGRIARANGRGREMMLSSLYGHIPELFSVAPLAGIAAVLLCGHLPRQWGRGEVPMTNRSMGTAKVDEFGVICCDYAGISSGATLQIV